MNPPAQPHSETSKSAARTAKVTASSLRGKILEYLTQWPFAGATDEQMQNDLRINPSTQRPRRVELCEMGLVVDSGMRRETLSGCKAVVWKIKQ